jgi:hypothetical protein
MVSKGGFNLRSFYFLGFYGIITAGPPIWASGKKKYIFFVGWLGPLEGLK